MFCRRRINFRFVVKRESWCTATNAVSVCTLSNARGDIISAVVSFNMDLFVWMRSVRAHRVIACVAFGLPFYLLNKLITSTKCQREREREELVELWIFQINWLVDKINFICFPCFSVRTLFLCCRSMAVHEIIIIHTLRRCANRAKLPCAWRTLTLTTYLLGNRRPNLWLVQMSRIMS